MDSSRSDDNKPAAPAASATNIDRRKFLGAAAATAGGLLLGDLGVTSDAHAQAGGQKFTDWGWPQPYEQISAKSKQWLESKGWWPLSAGWIVVWSGEEMIGNILQ